MCLLISWCGQVTTLSALDHYHRLYLNFCLAQPRSSSHHSEGQFWSVYLSTGSDHSLYQVPNLKIDFIVLKIKFKSLAHKAVHDLFSCLLPQFSSPHLLAVALPSGHRLMLILSSETALVSFGQWHRLFFLLCLQVSRILLSIACGITTYLSDCFLCAHHRAWKVRVLHLKLF